MKHVINLYRFILRDKKKFYLLTRDFKKSRVNSFITKARLDQDVFKAVDLIRQCYITYNIGEDLQPDEVTQIFTLQQETINYNEVF